MYNILIVSIENQNIRTEEIYFANKKNINELSLKRDKHLLSKLNLNDVFFFSINISASKTKILSHLKAMDKVNPQISECYLLCDRDKNSYNDIQIEKQFQKFQSVLPKKWKINENKIFNLWYRFENQKFENFLECHFQNRKLYNGYEKNDKAIYQKTMGKGGKNLQTLCDNINAIDGNKSFAYLFSARKREYD